MPEKRPNLTALRDDLALPCGVRGPVERFALILFAAIRDGVDMVVASGDRVIESGGVAGDLRASLLQTQEIELEFF